MFELERTEVTKLVFFRVHIPPGHDPAAAAGALWKHIGQGEISVRPGPDGTVIDAALEVPQRSRITVERVLGALPARLRNAARVELGGGEGGDGGGD